MKMGWKAKTLEEACQFSNGLWKGKKPPFVNVGVIRNTNFTKEGTLNDSDIAYLDVEAKKLEKRRLQSGDIILEKSGGGPKQPVGRVALFDKEEGVFSFSNFTAALRVLDPDELDFRYLHKFLHWTYLSGVTEGMQSHSTGIRNLDGGAYKAIQVSYPPLAEQQRIVGLLDEAFAGLATAKANAEKNLQNARALFESNLQSVFTQRGPGWVETTLGDICVVDWGNTDLTKSSYVEGGKYLAVSAAGCDGRIGHKEHAKHTPVLSAIGAQCGRMFLPEEDFTAIKNTITLTPRDGTCAGKFLYRLLTHVELPKRGAAQPFIAKGDILRFQIVVPEDSEAQLRIVDSLDALEEETQRLARLYERKLSALDALKKSLLHQAFNGELQPV